MQLNCFFRSTSCTNGVTCRWTRVLKSADQTSRRTIGKFLLAMNLTAVLMLTTCLYVTANTTTGQTVTLKVKDAPLKQVLVSIQEQTGFSVLFDNDLVERARAVTLDVRDMPLNQVMNLCLQNQPFEFTLENNSIIVKQKDVAVKIIPVALPEPIKGVVKDSTGAPLSGATVMNKRTKKSVMTNAKGEFSIDGEEGDVLIFTSIGYAQKEFKVRANQQIGTISLALSDSKLDEVQVIAYGTTTQRFSTGNVTTVKAEMIEKQPVGNSLLALQGLVPGLQVTQTTGMPGAGVTVLIQGRNSLMNGNSPFYVIDGVPYPDQLLPNLGTMLGTSTPPGMSSNAYGNPLSFINPQDIESIDVLKDAAATAIYGSRASNGAILITTKKGKAGKTKVDLNLQNGWARNTRRLPMMNTQQYLEMRHEALKNDGLEPSEYDYDISGLWDTTRNTDWQKILTGQTAQYIDLQASVSGGSATTSFLVSGNYHRETSVFPGDFANRRGSVHYNVSNRSANGRFNLQTTGQYLISDNQLPQEDLTGISILMPPNAPAIYNADGSINWATSPGGLSSWDNPATKTLVRYHTQTNNFINSLAIGYEVLPGLELKTNLQYNRLETKELTTRPASSVDPYIVALFGSKELRSSNFLNNNISTWSVEPQTTYKKIFGKGTLEAVLGATISQTNADGYTFTARIFNSDDQLEDMASASELSNPRTTKYQYKYSGVFARVNYNWQNKYLFDLSSRRDGSSRFGPENRFHNFAAIAGAWIFSSESFIAQAFPFLSFGKLRVSYGTTGNDQIGNYRYMDLYTTIIVNNNNNYQNTAGLTPSGLSNPYLQWEETRKFQGAIDLGFLKDRISFRAGFFRNRSSNQLLDYVLPIFTGFEGITRNFPATIQNSGWELTLRTENAKSKNWNWTTTINITIPKDKLISFENLEASSYHNQYTLGESIFYQRIWNYIGVNSETGNYQVADKDGNPTSNPNYTTDVTGKVYTNQKYYGGFQSNLRYKDFQLDLLFSFVKQPGQSHLLINTPGLERTNIDSRLLDRWQKNGDNAKYQKYSSSYANFEQLSFAKASQFGWEDASYIRLTNLSISWQLPKSWQSKAALRNFKLFVQARNLLTATRFQGLDPETLGALSLPPLKVITLGLQASW